MSRNRRHRREKRRARQAQLQQAQAEQTSKAPGRDRRGSVVYRVRGGGPAIRFDFFPYRIDAPDLETDFDAVQDRMVRVHRALWQAAEADQPS